MKVGIGIEQEFNIRRVIIPDAIQLDTYCFGRVSTSIYTQFCSDCLLKSLWWQLLYQSSLEYEVIFLIQELLNKLLLIYIVLNGDEHFSDSKMSKSSLLKLDGFCMCMCIFMCVRRSEARGTLFHSLRQFSDWLKLINLAALVTQCARHELTTARHYAQHFYVDSENQTQVLWLLAKYYIYWAISLGSRFSFKNYIKKHINTTQSTNKH